MAFRKLLPLLALVAAFLSAPTGWANPAPTAAPPSPPPSRPPPGRPPPPPPTTRNSKS
jgi:hypothetical protein